MGTRDRAGLSVVTLFVLGLVVWIPAAAGQELSCSEGYIKDFPTNQQKWGSPERCEQWFREVRAEEDPTFVSFDYNPKSKTCTLMRVRRDDPGVTFVPKNGYTYCELPSSSSQGLACGHELGGGILAKWQSLGGKNGVLGCPVGDEKEAARSPDGTSGRAAEFDGGDGGIIIWHRDGRLAGRSFEVHGCIFRIYKSNGAGSSWLGYPVSDEYDIESGRRSDFERGFVRWDGATKKCRAYRYGDTPDAPRRPDPVIQSGSGGGQELSCSEGYIKDFPTNQQKWGSPERCEQWFWEVRAEEDPTFVSFDYSPKSKTCTLMRIRRSDPGVTYVAKRGYKYCELGEGGGDIVTQYKPSATSDGPGNLVSEGSSPGFRCDGGYIKGLNATWKENVDSLRECQEWALKTRYKSLEYNSETGKCNLSDHRREGKDYVTSTTWTYCEWDR